MSEKITAVSLFTGAGGMDVGFENAGVKILIANELIKDISKTYHENHPNTKIINADINDVIDTFSQYNGADLVFGGPPCQGFSVAGKMNPNDKRSKLIFSYLDVVEKVHPKFFVMENVKALATLKKWSDIKNKYIAHANEIGYICFPFILNATEYDVSQKRERVFFIGIPKEKFIKKPFFEQEMLSHILKQKVKAPPVKKLLKNLGKAGSPENPATCTARITFATHPVMRKSPYAGMYFNGQGRPIDVDGYANTLPASMGGNKTPFIDEEYLYGNATSDWVVSYHRGLIDGTITPTFREAPSRLRRITIKEAARIQSFPDNYKFYGSRGLIYTQIGNAVPCKLAGAVAKAICEYILS